MYHQMSKVESLISFNKFCTEYTTILTMRQMVREVSNPMKFHQWQETIQTFQEEVSSPSDQD
jgi:hypothetical protein